MAGLATLTLTCAEARAGWLGRHLRRRGLDFTISSLTSNSRPVGVLLVSCAVSCAMNCRLGGWRVGVGRLLSWC
jgi:hypothetical protein